MNDFPVWAMILTATPFGLLGVAYAYMGWLLWTSEAGR